jgi:hypothetical protein
MRAHFLVLIGLAVGAIAVPAALASKPDQLLTSWARTQQKVRSLVVEFTLTIPHPVFHEDKHLKGTFKLIRTPKGRTFASYQVRENKLKGERKEESMGLLNGGSVYLLNQDKKTAIKFTPKDGDMKRFLTEYFNPFVMFLDKKRTHEMCRLEIVKQDKWFTYLSVKPRQIKGSGWLAANFDEGRVVLMSKDTKGVPRGMPRQLWYRNAVRDCIFDITTWRLNAADAPRLEEFKKPEDRRGWEVHEFPIKISMKQAFQRQR